MVRVLLTTIVCDLTNATCLSTRIVSSKSDVQHLHDIYIQHKKVVGFLNVLNLTTVVSRHNIKMLE